MSFEVELPSGLIVRMRKMRGGELARLAEGEDPTRVLASCTEEWVEVGPYTGARGPYAQLDPGDLPELPKEDKARVKELGARAATWRRVLAGDVGPAFFRLQAESTKEAAEVTFPWRCAGCDEQVEGRAKITEFPLRALPEASRLKIAGCSGAATDHFEATVGGRTYRFDLGLLAQADRMERFVRQQKRQKPNMIDLMVAQLVEVQGIAPRNVAEMYRALSDEVDGDDVLELQRAMQEADCGVDLTADVKCSCGWVQEVAVPFAGSRRVRSAAAG